MNGTNTLRNVTIANNSGYYSGGLFYSESSNTFINVILSNPGANCYHHPTAFPAPGSDNNLVSDGSCYNMYFGANLIYVDPVNDLVVVTRWLAGNRVNEFMRLVTSAVTGPTAAPPR